jgi:hypothetical protein
VFIFFILFFLLHLRHDRIQLLFRQHDLPFGEEKFLWIATGGASHMVCLFHEVSVGAFFYHSFLLSEFVLVGFVLGSLFGLIAIFAKCFD